MARTILARLTWDQGKESLWAAACNASASRRAIVNSSGRRPRISRPPVLTEPIVSIGGPSNSLQVLRAETLGRPEDEVKVIGHEDEGVEHPSRSSHGPLQAVHQPLAVGIVLDDVLPAVAPR